MPPQPPNSVPVFDDQGNFGYLPQQNIGQAVAGGYKTATATTNNDGKLEWVPTDKVSAALKSGYKMGLPSQQNAESNLAHQSDYSFSTPFGGPNDAINRYYDSFGKAIGAPAQTSDFITGPLHAVAHPIDSASLLNDAMNRSQSQATQYAMAPYDAGGNKPLAVANGLVTQIPFLGPQLAGASQQLNSGDIAGGLGTLSPLVLQALIGTPEGRASIGDLANSSKNASGRFADAWSQYPKDVWTKNARGQWIKDPGASIGTKLGGSLAAVVKGEKGQTPTVTSNAPAEPINTGTNGRAPAYFAKTPETAVQQIFQQAIDQQKQQGASVHPDNAAAARLFQQIADQRLKAGNVRSAIGYNVAGDAMMNLGDNSFRSMTDADLQNIKGIGDQTFPILKSLSDKLNKVQESPAHGEGGVSAEEIARPGKNYVISKSGGVSYHGKQFDPGSTPSGATHVTVLPDGTFRVNAGQMLTPVQTRALTQALR